MQLPGDKRVRDRLRCCQARMDSLAAPKKCEVRPRAPSKWRREPHFPTSTTHQLEGRKEKSTHVESLLSSDHRTKVHQREVRPIIIIITIVLDLGIFLRTRRGAFYSLTIRKVHTDCVGRKSTGTAQLQKAPGDESHQTVFLSRQDCGLRIQPNEQSSRPKYPKVYCVAYMEQENCGGGGL